MGGAIQIAPIEKVEKNTRSLVGINKGIVCNVNRKHNITVLHEIPFIVLLMSKEIQRKTVSKEAHH